MTKFQNLTIAASATALLAGCMTAAGADGAAVNEATSDSVVAAADAPSWPPSGCPDEAALRSFVNNPGYQDNMVYFGLYSDGNVFWIGSEHGTRVFSPNIPFVIPNGRQPYVMRWNIGDTPPGGQPVNANYKLEYDASLHGAYAVSAFAINKCETDELGNYGSCDQPLFGEPAWQEDAEFCPPIILSEDPNSVYLWDRNEPRAMPQVYEYSLSLILKAQRPNDPKAGIRIIVDPKVQNGGQDK